MIGCNFVRNAPTRIVWSQSRRCNKLTAVTTFDWRFVIVLVHAHSTKVSLGLNQEEVTEALQLQANEPLTQPMELAIVNPNGMTGGDAGFRLKTVNIAANFSGECISASAEHLSRSAIYRWQKCSHLAASFALLIHIHSTMASRSF